jgi:hypothetical protein
MRRSWIATSIGTLSLLFVSAMTNGQASQDAAARATLMLSTNGRGPMYIEGAIQFYRVLSTEGKKIKEGEVSSKSPSVELEPGSYELVSYVRPCDGNCGLLDPPADECRAKFSIKPGQTLYAVRQQTSKGPCTLTVSDTDPKKP